MRSQEKKTVWPFPARFCYPPGMSWKNRIVEQRDIPPGELIANPSNWRKHPKAQLAALTGVLGEVGLVQGVVFNRRTGHLLDGHLRVELALRHGQTTVPTTVVDLDEKEEALILATFDPLGAMAETDKALFLDLRDAVVVENEALTSLLDSLASEPLSAPPSVSGDKSSDVRMFIFTLSMAEGDVVDRAFATVRTGDEDDGKVLVEICSRVIP